VLPSPPALVLSDARDRARRPALAWGLVASVLLHGVLMGAWRLAGPLAPDELPRALPPYTPLELTVVPELQQVDEPPGGSSSPPDAAVASPPTPTPASVTPESPLTPAEVITGSTVAPVPDASPLTVIHPPTPIAGTVSTGGGRPGGTGTGDGGTGDGDGTGGGTGDGDGDGTGDGPATPPPIVRDPDRAPFCANQTFPVWPEAARREGYRARARVELLVNAGGQVQEARIVERMRLGRGDREESVPSLPYGIDDAMLRAARASRCRPARQAGAAVTSYATITLSVGL